MTNETDPVEELLARYRPVGPPESLRRGLCEPAEAPSRDGVSRWWLSIAAMLAVVVGLQFASQRVERQIAGMLAIGQIQWTPEVEELAEMLDAGGGGRQYLALSLAADLVRQEMFPPRIGGPVGGVGDQPWAIR